MVRERVLTKAQLKTIQEGIRRGYSANKIQKQLQQLRIGIRRQDLLRCIRIAKSIRIKLPRPRYVPRFVPRKPAVKAITLIGRHRGRKMMKRVSGTGRQLYNFVVSEMLGDYLDTPPEIVS